MIDQSQLEEAVSKLSAEHLLPFFIAMVPNYPIAWHLRLLAQKLEAVERGEIKRLMVFMPPRHYKSLSVSQLFPAWYLGRNPTKQVITSTYSHFLASTFGRNVRNFMDEPRYHSIFPEVLLAEDSHKKDRFHTNKGGVYIASGVGGSFTGYGADLFIIDDPHKDRADVESKAKQENILSWYNAVATTRLTPNGAVILVQTRWRDDDLAGTVLENAEAEGWDVVSLPAIAEEDELFRKKGEALFPEEFNLEHLLKIKQELFKINPDDWHALYQQNPLNAENMEFKRSYFQYFKDDECPGNLRIFTTVDPAISKAESADESCIMTVGVAPDNSKYILEYSHGRWDPSELINEIFHHVEKYESLIVGIETVAYQQALSHFFKLEMKKRGRFFRVEEIKSRTEKEIRIRGLIAHYKAKVIYHRAGFSEALEAQLMRFPKGAHDDIADALAMQQQLWSPPATTKWSPSKSGKTIRQLMKEEGMLKANQ